MFTARFLRDCYDPFESRLIVAPRRTYGLDDYHDGVHLLENLLRQSLHRSMSNAAGDCRMDGNNFKVMLNAKHFRPDEIEVKTVDNFVVIHGKHEEQADEHGFVSREFTRRYQLPDDVEPEKVISSFSKDGVLTIQAPRKQLEPPPRNERVVPITIQQPAAVEEAQRQQEQQQQNQTESSEQ